jgi:hypothetical protein
VIPIQPAAETRVAPRRADKEPTIPTAGIGDLPSSGDLALDGRREFLKSPQRNGVCERAFGSLMYEHRYRLESDRFAAEPATTYAAKSTSNPVQSTAPLNG